jgi:hypothetical protein
MAEKSKKNFAQRHMAAYRARHSLIHRFLYRGTQHKIKIAGAKTYLKIAENIAPACAVRHRAFHRKYRRVPGSTQLVLHMMI